MNFPLLSRFSTGFWKYRFPWFSWNFTISCTHFLAFQGGENSCPGAPNIDFQLGKRPKSVGWMVWTGRVFEWGWVGTFQALFSRPAAFDPYMDHPHKNFHLPGMPGNVCRKWWNSRKKQEIYIFKNRSKTGLKAGNQKNKTTLTLTTFKVVRVKVVLFFRFSHY